jgi:hypothetical protein
MRTVQIFAALLLASLLSAQSTGQGKSGLPDPPKKDVPYVIHADLLVETETGEAKQETRKDEQVFSIPGAASTVKTPFASPEFLFLSDSLPADKLQLFKLGSKNGRREVVLVRKKKIVAQPVRLSITPIHDKLFRIRVEDSLTPGEYALSPDGSNAVFCFAVQ